MNKFDKALEIRRKEVREQRSRALEQQRLRAKKEQRKDIIMCVIFIILMIILIAISMKLGQKSINDCINAGHSKAYCERGA